MYYEVSEKSVSLLIIYCHFFQIFAAGALLDERFANLTDIFGISFLIGWIFVPYKFKIVARTATTGRFNKLCTFPPFGHYSHVRRRNGGLNYDKIHPAVAGKKQLNSIKYE